MLLIKKKNGTDSAVKRKVVGAWLPQPLVEFLNLVSVCKGVSKGKLIENLLDNWVNGTINNRADYDYYVCSLSDKIKESWDNYNKVHKNARLSIFQQEIRNEILKKGINTETIETALKLVDYGKKK